MERRAFETDVLVFYLCVAGYALLAFLYPWKHSPDGNLYYLVTLMLSRGELAAAIDGVSSPLLSWLMLLPHSLGAPLPAAYRIVNVFAVLIFLLAARRLARIFFDSPLPRSLVLILSLVLVAYVSLSYTTSDLLAGALALYLLELLLLARGATLKQGFLLALVYHAKAFQLFPSALLMLLSPFILGGGLPAFKQRIRAVLLALLFCAPWVLTLSVKYGAPVISAQQLIFSHRLPLEFSPYNVPLQAAHKSTQPSITHVAADLSRRFKLSAATVREQAGAYVFGESGFIAFLSLTAVGMLLSMKAGRPAAARLLSLACVLQILLYFPIWGARFRYYFPILVPMVILATQGVWALVQRCKVVEATLRWRARPLSVPAGLALALLALGIVYRSGTSLAASWSSTDNQVIRALAASPKLKGEGPVAGLQIDDQSAPLASYYLERPFWWYLGLHLDEPPERIASLLRRERVSKVIVSGEPPEVLRRVPGLVSLGTAEARGTLFTIYNFTEAHGD